MKRKLTLNFSDFRFEIAQVDVKGEVLKRRKIEMDELKDIPTVSFEPSVEDLKISTLEEPFLNFVHQLIDNIPISEMHIPQFASQRIIPAVLQIKEPNLKFDANVDGWIIDVSEHLQELELPIVSWKFSFSSLFLPELEQLNLPTISNRTEVNLGSLDLKDSDANIMEPSPKKAQLQQLPLLDFMVFLPKIDLVLPKLDLMNVDILDLRQHFLSVNTLHSISKTVFTLAIDEPSSKKIPTLSLIQPQFVKVDLEMPKLHRIKLLQSSFLSSDIVSAISQLLNPAKSFKVNFISDECQGEEHLRLNIPTSTMEEHFAVWKNLDLNVSSVYEPSKYSERVDSDYLYLEDFFQGRIYTAKSFDTEEIVESSQKDHDMAARLSEDEDCLISKPALDRFLKFNDPEEIIGFSASNAVEKFMHLRGRSKVFDVKSSLQSPSFPLVPTSPSAPVSIGDFSDATKNYWEQLQDACNQFKLEQVSNQKYLASSGVIKDQSLLLTLEREFNVELVERELSSKAVILDSKTVLVLIPFQDLMKTADVDVRSTTIGDSLNRLGGHFSKIHLVFEKITSNNPIRANPFTPPTCEAISKLEVFIKRDLSSALGTSCKIWYSINDLQTAAIIRICGNVSYGTTSLDDRSWLSDVPTKVNLYITQQELFLTHFPGLNHFSSQLILLKYSLAKLAQASEETLIRDFQSFIPPSRMKLFLDHFHRPFDSF